MNVSNDSPIDFAFYGLLEHYLQNLSNLQEFSLKLGLSAKELDSDRQLKFASELESDIRRIGEEQDGKTQLRILRELLERRRERLERIAGGEMGDDVDADDADENAIDSLSWVALRLYGKVSKAYLTTNPIHNETLVRGTIMALVSHAELLMSSLMTLFYKKFPDAISIDERNINLKELVTLSSISEAVDLVISRKVDDLIRGGYDEWSKFFDKNLGIKLSTVIPCWQSWTEVFQRRHLYVHSDGVADKRYVTKVDWLNVEPWIIKVEEGDKVLASDDYVANALQLFQAAGFILTHSAWGKLSADESKSIRGDSLHLTIYNMVFGHQWMAAEHATSFALFDKTVDESSHLMFLFNRWLSIKRLGRWEEIRTEVESFDHSAKHPRFRLARASLMELADEFFEVLPSSGLGEEEIQTWPILEEMRLDPRYPAPTNAADSIDAVLEKVDAGSNDA